MDELQVQFDDDGTWLCRHVTYAGEPAPNTRLRLDETDELNPGFPTSTPRRWTYCPDCGTYWRVWMNPRIAKPTAEWNATDEPESDYVYRRAPMLDIDRVIDLVKAELSDVSVVQYEGICLNDDEGVWQFLLPNMEDYVQLYSPTGMCPFFAKHKDVASVQEAARMVVEYLRGEANG